MSESSSVERRPRGPDDSQSPATPLVATISKQPPPESRESIRVRQLVILSFWAIVVFLGLPIWWWTTSVYRARLPLQEMEDWAEGKSCRPTFPLEILVESLSLQEPDINRIVRATQHALDDQNDFSPHHLRLRVGSNYAAANSSQQQWQYDSPGQNEPLYQESNRPKESALTVRLAPQSGLATARAELRTQSTLLDILYPLALAPPASSTSFPLANFVATQLQDLFAEEQAIIAHTLTLNPSSYGSHQPPASAGQLASTSNVPMTVSKDHRSGRPRALSPELAARLASRATRALKYAPTYHITISLFTPNAWPSSWEIEPAIAEYLTPLLDSASIISNFTIDTQTQLYASFSPSVQESQYDADRGVWTLRQEDLSSFINAAEWPLSPSIGSGPTLNFIIYVPDSATTPLTIKESQTTSWLIPQWGGVMILNPSLSLGGTSAQASKLSKEDIQPALLVFSHQLLSFLGAPQSPPSIPLQLQTLTRVRAASLFQSASATLGSLARLTVALPSIAIPKTVSTAVEVTLDHLEATCNALKDGRFNAALEHAKTAEIAAEQGFFEKSMVGQVYFPDEHKVAVYLPLLGPVGVPLIMSALKELKRMWLTRHMSHPGP
ncbi:MAG: hypothetical protein LQ339_003604 [Xanthoria mediterranea]|nr:MAG: hypothetical protein LQ339_003604 [Xanthoria mediterranea]